MRYSLMSLPILLAAHLPLAAAIPLQDNKARCPKPLSTPEKASFKRLGDLPPAEAFRAVLRSDEDCRGQLVQARDRLAPVPRERR